MIDYNPKLIVDRSDVQEALKATFVVNKLAKKYASLASEAYESNNYYEASRCSDRKAALYAVKENALSAILSTQGGFLVDHTRHKMMFHNGCRLFHHLTFEVGGRVFKFHYKSDRAREFLPEWVEEKADVEWCGSDSESEKIDIDAVDGVDSVEESLQFLAGIGFDVNCALDRSDISWDCLEDIDSGNVHEGLCGVDTCPNQAIWMHHFDMNVCGEHKIRGVHDNHCHIDEF